MTSESAIWQLKGLTFTAVLGTALHFLYEWTGIFAFAPFSAVNESTWEHMKIFFFPTFFFAIAQSFFLKKEYPNFWWIKLVGIVLGTTLIPVLFYTYNGAFGKSPGWLNILFFFLAAFLSYSAEGFLFNKKQEKRFCSIAAIVLLCLIAFAFIVWTFYPPKLPLFQDPIGGYYGLKR